MAKALLNPEPPLTLSGSPALELTPARSALRYGVVVGLLFGGLALSAAGGGRAGAAVSLLAPLFPGYAATLPGAAFGVVYGVAAGCAAGWLVAKIYNRLSG